MAQLISKSHDPIGEALLDYYNNERGHLINVKTNIALDEKLDASYFYREFSEMPKIEQIALEHCRGNVLDVGAGAGSHSLYLQNKKIQVRAIDISPKSVEVMKLRGVEHAYLQNFNSVNKPKYDTLLFLMNGFGMTKKIDLVSDFLSHCESILNDNGQILFDSSDIKYLYEQEDGSYLFNLNSNYYGEVTYQISYRNINGEEFEWLFIDPENLKAICEKNNLKLEILFQDAHFQYLGRITKN